MAPLVCCRRSWCSRTAARGTWCSASTSPPCSRAHPRCSNTPLKKKSRVSTRPSVLASDHTAAADATPLTTDTPIRQRGLELEAGEAVRALSYGAGRGRSASVCAPRIPACGLGFLLASHQCRLERGKKWSGTSGPLGPSDSPAHTQTVLSDKSLRLSEPLFSRLSNGHGSPLPAWP